MADRGVGADGDVGADADTILDRHIGADTAAGPDHDMLTDHRAGGDLGAFADPGAGGHGGFGVNAALGRGAGIEQMADAGKGQARIVGQQQHAVLVRQAAEFPAGDDDAGPAVGESLGQARIGKDAEFTRLRQFQIGDIAHKLGGMFGPGQFGPDSLRDLAQGERPGGAKKSCV